MLEREQVVSTIRVYGEELSRRLRAEGSAEGQGSERGSEGAERSVFVEAFAAACQQNGVNEEEVREAILADPSLSELEDAVIQEALVGAPDPGPYDAISRESPSGSSENQHLGAYGAAAVGAKISE